MEKNKHFSLYLTTLFPRHHHHQPSSSSSLSVSWCQFMYVCILAPQSLLVQFKFAWLDCSLWLSNYTGGELGIVVSDIFFFAWHLTKLCWFLPASFYSQSQVHLFFMVRVPPLKVLTTIWNKVDFFSPSLVTLMDDVATRGVGGIKLLNVDTFILVSLFSGKFHFHLPGCVCVWVSESTRAKWRAPPSLAFPSSTTPLRVGRGRGGGWVCGNEHTQ